MDTKLFHTDDNEIADAGEILRNGGLVAFPTETVYGLGASGRGIFFSYYLHSGILSGKNIISHWTFLIKSQNYHFLNDN